MKLLPYLAFLLLAPLPYGQENPGPDKVIQNVEKLATGGLGKISKENADKPQKLVVGTERIHFFDGSDLKGAMLKLKAASNTLGFKELDLEHADPFSRR